MPRLELDWRDVFVDRSATSIFRLTQANFCQASRSSSCCGAFTGAVKLTSNPSVASTARTSNADPTRANSRYMSCLSLMP